MRQYYILYKRALGQWNKLNSRDHAGLYDRHEVAQAIDYMAANPAVEGIALRLNDDEMFNIVSFVQDAEAPLAFPFPPTH